jgi:hypothetical protein
MIIMSQHENVIKIKLYSSINYQNQLLFLYQDQLWFQSRSLELIAC